MDERCRDNSEHNGLYPAPGFTVGLVGRLALLMFFTEKEPRQIFRNVDVEYDGQSEKHPRIARPYHEPQNINYRYDGKFGPSIPEKRTHLTPKFLHCSVVLSILYSYLDYLLMNNATEHVVHGQHPLVSGSKLRRHHRTHGESAAPLGLMAQRDGIRH